eukprot:SM000053S17499  [mRNA]  locus=s53:748100:748855:- [translate_table: standard]
MAAPAPPAAHWCHACRREVALAPAPTSDAGQKLCGACGSGFVEELGGPSAPAPPALGLSRRDRRHLRRLIAGYGAAAAAEGVSLSPSALHLLAIATGLPEPPPSAPLDDAAGPGTASDSLPPPAHGQGGSSPPGSSDDTLSSSGVQQQEGGPVEGAGEQQTDAQAVAQELDDTTAARPPATEPRPQEQLAAAATSGLPR